MRSFVFMIGGGLCVTTGLLLGLALDQANVLYPHYPVHRASVPTQVDALINATFALLPQEDPTPQFTIPSKRTVPDADFGTLQWLGYPVAVG